MQKVKIVDHQKIIGLIQQIGQMVLTEKDASLYAVGIGFNLDPLRQQDFKYTNQKAADFTTFPTITAVMKLSLNLNILRNSPYVPQYGIHQLLHAEQKLYMLHSKIKIDAKYRQTVQVLDVVDKGKNGFFYLRHSAYTKNEKGVQELAFYIDRTMFIRDLGGFGFKGNGKAAVIPNTPKRNPDYVLNDRTYPSQAFIYRLSNDLNTLHIDPQIAKKAGFNRPIIHGMASYGTIARCIVQNLLGNNPQSIKSYEVRLVGHVFPGQSFEIKVWKDGNRYHFQAEVIQRKTKALIGVLTTRQTPKI